VQKKVYGLSEKIFFSFIVSEGKKTAGPMKRRGNKEGKVRQPANLQRPALDLDQMTLAQPDEKSANAVL